MKTMQEIKDLILPGVRGFEYFHLKPALGENSETDIQLKEDGNLHFGFWVSYKPLIGGWRVLFTSEDIRKEKYKGNLQSKLRLLCNEILNEFNLPSLPEPPK